ncbi:MAG: DUF3108 domain-containing protein [Pseudomonadota bacterium]
MSKLTFSISLGLVALALPLSYASAGTVNSKLNVSFMGIGIAQMKNSYAIDGSRYSVSGSVKTNPLISIVSSTKASFRSNGVMNGSSLLPTQHELTFSQRRKKGRLALLFANGNVTKQEVLPKKRFKKGQVPLVPAHLKAVLDPVSALIFPVTQAKIGDGNSVCNRTVPVYDGNNRLNLKFSYKASRTVRAKGFNGPAFVCSVRYQPIAGHRPERKNTKFMVANRDMEVTMARLGNSNAYGLFAFRVKTRRGVAKGVATAFHQN